MVNIASSPAGALLGVRLRVVPEQLALQDHAGRACGVRKERCVEQQNLTPRRRPFLRRAPRTQNTTQSSGSACVQTSQP